MSEITVGTRVTDGTRTGRVVRVESRPFAMDYLVRWGNAERGTWYRDEELTIATKETA